MREMLYEVRCLKSNENMILALAGQFKQLSHMSPTNLFDFKHRTSYNISFIKREIVYPFIGSRRRLEAYFTMVVKTY